MVPPPENGELPLATSEEICDFAREVRARSRALCDYSRLLTEQSLIARTDAQNIRQSSGVARSLSGLMRSQRSEGLDTVADQVSRLVQGPQSA